MEARVSHGSWSVRSSSHADRLPVLTGHGDHRPGASRLGVTSTYELIRKAGTDDPERTAIALPDGSARQECLSYRTLLKTIHQVANLLVDLGVERGDVIHRGSGNLWQKKGNPERLITK